MNEALAKYAASFQRRPGTVPLNNAAFAPLNGRAAMAMQEMIASMGRPDAKARAQWVQQYRSAHTVFAQMLGCKPAELSFMPNVASAFSAIALAMDLRAGDEIVTVDQEYASNAYPWREAAARAGAKIVAVQSAADYSIDTSALVALIGPRTRAVAVSWVQFQTGVTLDLILLSQVCKKHGCLLIVDTTQGVGIAPFSMSQWEVDIVSGSLHKWLAGPPGLAYLAIRQDLIPHFRPRVVGPYSYGETVGSYDPAAQLLASAARFQSGTPALIPIAGAAAAAQALLEAGIENLSQHALALALRLRQGLIERGHQVLSPAAMTSPIVSFLPRQGLEAATQRLAARGISFAPRAGGLRLSPHAFNTEEDIDEALRALSVREDYKTRPRG